MIMILQYISINMYVLNLHYVICQIDRSKVGKIFFCLGMIITSLLPYTYTHTHTCVCACKKPVQKIHKILNLCLWKLINFFNESFHENDLKLVIRDFFSMSICQITFCNFQEINLPLCANKFSLLLQILYISSKIQGTLYLFYFSVKYLLIYRPLPNPAFLLFWKMTF